MKQEKEWYLLRDKNGVFSLNKILLRQREENDLCNTGFQKNPETQYWDMEITGI